MSLQINDLPACDATWCCLPLLAYDRAAGATTVQETIIRDSDATLHRLGAFELIPS